MKHLNTKEISPDAHAGSPQENTRVPASRYSGKRSRAGRATIPYIIARLFSCAQANLFALAAILAFAASCVAKIDEGAPVVGDGERLVTLSLTTPSASPTRGLTTLEEDAVHTVDVLLFKGEDFFYRATGSALDASKNFTVKLPSSAAPYKAVVLANARAMLSAIPLSREQSPGTTRTSLLDSITQTLSGSISGWTSALATAGIPMWGYENDLAVNESSYNPAATISLTRMLSKIDITVEDDVTNFKLASVRLYNYSGTGSIAPAASTSGISGYDIAQWNGVKAIAPHLPTGAKVGAGLYIDYPISASPGITRFTNEIYAYEAQAGAANTLTNTCLVIGGYYEGSTTPTYYRVEFVGTDGTTFLHLLRNHKYAVEIKEVTAHGYSTANDAYVNKPINIVVQITPWNDGGLDDITFDGQHYLAVDKSEIILYASGEAKSMIAKTDFPAGWTVNANDLPTWLTITAPVLDGSGIAHGLQDVKTTLTLAAALTSTAREDEFYIVAGNLRKKIIVKQLAEAEFSLSITDLSGNPINELTFGPGADIAAAKQFRVTWLPADADCDVALAPVSGMPPFTFDDSGTGIDPVADAPFTGGSATITIQPNDLSIGDPNPLSRLDFSVARDGQYRTAVLYLRQVNNNYVIVESVASEYVADGSTTHSFTVKSNCQWLSYLDGDGSDLDDLINWKTPSGGPNPAGESFEFILNVRSNAEPATISFTNLDHSITYATATIHGAPLHVTLAKTTYGTNAPVPPPADISMTTNIPVGELTATVSGSGGLVTGATIEAGPALRVNFATNTLTGATFQTYTVQVKHGANVMATLTVHVSGSGWEIIDGKLVEPIGRIVAVDKFLTDETNCPAGSSSPRSSDDAMWYELWLGQMDFILGTIIDGTGVRDGDLYGVIWYGTALQQATFVATGDPTIYYTLPCVWNQTILSEDVGHIDLNVEPVNNITTQPTRFAYGQLVRIEDTHILMQFRCVVW